MDTDDYTAHHEPATEQPGTLTAPGSLQQRAGRCRPRGR